MRDKLLFLYSILISFSLFAQEVDETTLKINRDGGGVQADSLSGSSIGITDYLVVIFVLIIVIGALYFVLKVIKKVGASRIGLDNDQIKVLSTKVLKGTTALHLVEVGNQIFLVGATDSSINNISEITDQETKDTIILNSTNEADAGKSFVQLFTDKLKSFNGGSTESDEATGSIKTQSEKLDRF